MFDLDVACPEMDVTLIRRVAMITGASRGIGAAIALVLAEQGFRVVVNHRASAPQAAMSPSHSAKVPDRALGKAVSRRQTLRLGNTSHPGRPGPDELVPSRYALRGGEIDALVVSDGVLPIPAPVLATNADPAVDGHSTDHLNLAWTRGHG